MRRECPPQQCAMCFEQFSPTYVAKLLGESRRAFDVE
jgi:hypothetical protein